MSDRPPIVVNSPSTDLARVRVQTTREAPALPGGRVDSPLFAVTASGPLAPPQRRRAAAIAGVSEAALRGERAVLARATSAAAAAAAAAPYLAAGVPAEVLPPGGPSARLRVLATGVPAALTLALLIAGLLPLAALSAAALIGMAAWLGHLSRRAEAAGREIAAGHEALERERAADRSAPAAALIARVHALRRRVVEADLPERAEADLLAGLSALLAACREEGAREAGGRDRLERALEDLEAATGGMCQAGADRAAATAAETAERARLVAASLVELTRTGPRDG